MGMLQKVVGDTFDIDLHYYALINYTSVKEVVDALGGIDVTVTSPDPRGIYDPNFPPTQGGPLKLTNGTHHVNGQTALRLTRDRGSTYGSYGFPLSDFNRTQNQQQVFTAIKNQLNWTLVLDPRTNGEIFEAAGNNVKTDVNIHEVIPLYRLFVSVPNGNLKPISLRELNGVNLLTGYTTPTGQSALIPTAGVDDYSQIKAHIDKLSH
jgi:LCP family protein required for cell wall assembly